MNETVTSNKVKLLLLFVVVVVVPICERESEGLLVLK